MTILIAGKDLNVFFGGRDHVAQRNRISHKRCCAQICLNAPQLPEVSGIAQTHRRTTTILLLLFLANIGASKRPWSMQNVLWLLPIRNLYKNPVLIVIQAQGLFAKQKYGQQMEIAV